MEEILSSLTLEQIQNCFDQALTTFSGLVSSNLQLTRVLVALNRSSHTNEKAVLREIHMAHKRSKRHQHTCLERVQLWVELTANLLVQQSRLVPRLNQRLRQKILSKLQTFVKHQRHLQEFTAAAERLFTMETKIADADQVNSMLPYQSISKLIIEENNRLYQTAIDKVVQLNFVSSFEEFMQLEERQSPRHASSKMFEPIKFQRRIKKTSRKVSKASNTDVTDRNQDKFEGNWRSSNRVIQKKISGRSHNDTPSGQFSPNGSLMIILEKSESTPPDHGQQVFHPSRITDRGLQPQRSSFGSPQLPKIPPQMSPVRRQLLRREHRWEESETIGKIKAYSKAKERFATNFRSAQIRALTLDGDKLMRSPRTKIRRFIKGFLSRTESCFKQEPSLRLKRQRSYEQVNEIGEKILTEEHHLIRCHRVALEAVNQQNHGLPLDISGVLNIYSPRKKTEESIYEASKFIPSLQSSRNQPSPPAKISAIKLGSTSYRPSVQFYSTRERRILG